MNLSIKIHAQLLLRRPLLPFLCSMLIGQLLARSLQLGALPLLLVSAINLLLLHTLRKQLSCLVQVLGFGLFTGIVSICLQALALPSALDSAQQGAKPTPRYFTASLSQPARFPMPGAAELQLLALERSAEPKLGPAPVLRLSCRAVDLPWRNVSTLQTGDIFMMAASLSPLVDDGVASYGAQLRRRNVDARCKVLFASRSLQVQPMPWWITLAELGERHLYQLLPKDEVSGLLLSISFGKRDLLSQRTEQTFRVLGLSHVLVVSGFQVSLLYALSYCFFSRLLALSDRLVVHARVRPIAALLGLCSSFIFVALCGFEASALRALLAVTMIFLSLFREHDASLGQAILLTGLLLSALWPGCLFDLGMQLTFAALIGIWLGQGLATERGWPALRTAFYASVCPSLVAALWFQPITLQALLVNLTGAPLLASSICVATLAGLGLSLSGLDGSGYLLKAVYWFVLQLRDIAWLVVSPAQTQISKVWTASQYCLWLLLLGVVLWRLFLRLRERLLYPRM